MALFFKDRLPQQINGQNARFYDAVANDGSTKLSDFKLVLKNNIPPGNEGEPLSAGTLNYASGNAALTLAKGQTVLRGEALTFTPGGASLANTRARTVAAASTQVNLQSVIKLTDSKLMLVYFTGTSDSLRHPGVVVIADIDWANKSVVMGEAHSVTNVNTVEVISPELFCYVDNYHWTGAASVRYGRALLHLCTVSGRTVTTHTGMNITDGDVGSVVSVSSNPARMSGNSVMIVHEWRGVAQYRAYEARHYRIYDNYLDIFKKIDK